MTAAKQIEDPERLIMAARCHLLTIEIVYIMLNKNMKQITYFILFITYFSNGARKDKIRPKLH